MLSIENPLWGEPRIHGELLRMLSDNLGQAHFSRGTSGIENYDAKSFILFVTSGGAMFAPRSNWSAGRETGSRGIDAQHETRLIVGEKVGAVFEVGISY
jgi:hypothetical protein